jgi:hypothetical protein
MRLHQIKIDYVSEQDRLLMQLATSDANEVRMWMTRRFVRVLWPLLIKLAEEASPGSARADPEARLALLNLEHEEAMARADFPSPMTTQRAPCRSAPSRCCSPGSRPAATRPARLVVAMHPVEGQGATLTFDSVLLHGRKLLQAAVEERWDMELKLPASRRRRRLERSVRTIN